MHYDNTNTGTLWLETELKHERSPNFTGKLNVAGKDYRIVGWNKTTKTNKDLISLVVSEFEDKPAGGAWEQQRQKFAKKDVAPTEVSDISDEDFYKSIPF